MNWWHLAEDLHLIRERFEEAEVTHSLLLNFAIREKFFEENKVRFLKFRCILACECLIDESWLSNIIIVHLSDCWVHVNSNKTIVIVKLDLVMLKLENAVEDVGWQLPRLLLQELIESKGDDWLDRVEVLVDLQHIHVEVSVVRSQFRHVHKRRVVHTDLTKVERLNLIVKEGVSLVESKVEQAVLDGQSEHFIKSAIVQPKLNCNIALNLHSAIVLADS